MNCMLKGCLPEAEERMVARDINLAELTGGKIHICYISTNYSVELVREAKKKEINITAETTPHHLSLTEECVLHQGTNAKVNPLLRTEKDVAALIRGINDGTIDAIATDHAPHTIADKSGDLPSAAFGISGLDCRCRHIRIPWEKYSLEQPYIEGQGNDNFC